MTKVIIYGAGVHGAVLHDILTESSNEVVCFIDAAADKQGQTCCDLPINQPESSLKQTLEKYGASHIALGVGDNAQRKDLFEQCEAEGIKPIDAIHPSAIISKSASIGTGVAICAGAIVQPRSIIGDNVIINTGATIDHDGKISSHSHISPGANLAGTVTVEEGAWLGTGCAVIPEITIGEWSIVGAGSSVIRNIPSKVVAVGVPAKTIKNL